MKKYTQKDVKYDVKSIKCGRKGEEWSIIRMYSNLRGHQLIMYVYVAIDEPHANCKPRIYDKYTHKKGI